MSEWKLCDLRYEAYIEVCREIDELKASSARMFSDIAELKAQLSEANEIIKVLAVSDISSSGEAARHYVNDFLRSKEND